jgi:hypothetical protein
MSAPLSIRRLRAAISRVRFRAYLPHTTFPHALAKGVSLSDQFLYRGDIAANRFVAENALALMLGQPVEVTHRLFFFDPQGRPLAEQTFTSSRYFESIPIDPIASNPPTQFATFLHATTYAEAALPEEERRTGFLRSLQRLHRGYCLYQRTPDSVFSAVHGNFGGIVTDAARSPARHQLLARHRDHFLYTPQHHFSRAERVSLYLMNSCPSTETVEVIRPADGVEGEARPHASLQVPSMGVGRCVLEGVEGYLSFRSRLPMCRPLVFVENGDNPCHFDVFHT